MAKTTKHDSAQVKELLLQALETERVGIKVYTAAIKAVLNEDLKTEFQEYLEQTTTHEQVLTRVFEELAMDTEEQSPGREVVAHQGRSLVAAIEMAMKKAPAESAELVAAECVVLAETKDHQNWELVGHVAKHSKADLAQRRSTRWSRTRIITCTTPRAGAASCGSSRPPGPRW